MKEIIKNGLLILGFRITKQFRVYPLFKKNVFKTSYKKNVLISYLVEPFVIGINLSHSNLKECFTAAEIFNDLGYNVDVIDFSIKMKIDYSKYSVVYGMGEALERSFYVENNLNITRIFYATGCNPIYANIATVLKVREFNERNNKILLGSSRIMNHGAYAQILLSDFVTVLGNSFVLDTYTSFDKSGSHRYLNLNAFYSNVYDIDLDKKDYKQAKKHFLWFGSTGLLHKGLDIVLDIFSQREDIYLHICGASIRERAFFDYYKQTLQYSKNITNHGFVNMESEQFKQLMDCCVFVISPSVSEGGAPALLNVMANGGLLPLVTRSSGLDIDGLGWTIEKEDNNIQGFSKIIDEVLLLQEDDLRIQSKSTRLYVKNNYSYEKYKQELQNIIGISLQYQNWQKVS